MIHRAGLDGGVNINSDFCNMISWLKWVELILRALVVWFVIRCCSAPAS